MKHLRIVHKHCCANIQSITSFCTIVEKGWLFNVFAFLLFFRSICVWSQWVIMHNRRCTRKTTIVPNDSNIVLLVSLCSMLPYFLLNIITFPCIRHMKDNIAILRIFSICQLDLNSWPPNCESRMLTHQGRTVQYFNNVSHVAKPFVEFYSCSF